jgi:peptidoglycan/LPS O-acetylase OafA/YrhL
MKKSTFVYLDMARGLAALAVMLEHIRSFVFVPYSQLAVHDPLNFLIWSGTSLGHQAVTLFFALSGFFIARSVIEDDQLRGFEWRTYLIKRLTRLWVVLIPCLVLTLFFDKFSEYIAGDDFYSGKLFATYIVGPMLQDGGAHYDVLTLLGNFFFLQSIFVHVFGSNGPLWSLSYEFWYYMMFPLLYLGLFRSLSLWRTVLYLCMFLATAKFVGIYIMVAGLTWLGGAIAYIIYSNGWFRSELGSPSACFIAIIFFVCALALTKVSGIPEYVQEFGVEIAAIFVVQTLAWRDSTNRYFTAIARVLSKGSYTVYLAHFPFAALIANCVLSNYRFHDSPAGYAVFFATSVSVWLYCGLVYWLFERHSGNVRNYCLKLFGDRVNRAELARPEPVLADARAPRYRNPRELHSGNWNEGCS